MKSSEEVSPKLGKSSSTTQTAPLEAILCALTFRIPSSCKPLIRSPPFRCFPTRPTVRDIARRALILYRPKRNALRCQLRARSLLVRLRTWWQRVV